MHLQVGLQWRVQRLQMVLGQTLWLSMVVLQQPVPAVVVNQQPVQKAKVRRRRHARLPQADGRANHHRRDSRRGGSAAAWRASAQRVSVGDSSSSAGSFFYIVLGARAESLGLRLSLDSVGGLLRVAMLLVVVRVSYIDKRRPRTARSTPARPSSAAAAPPWPFAATATPPEVAR